MATAGDGTRRRPTTRSAALVFGLCTFLGGCGWLQDLRDEQPGIRIERLSAPAGRRVTVFAQDIAEARQMTLGPPGVLLVSSGKGRVYALDIDGERATRARTLVSGLEPGVGIAYQAGTLFVATRTRILRYDGVDRRLDQLPEPITIVDGLPDKSRHGARFLALGPDGRLYVSVGSPCNVCEASDDEYGTILSFSTDGSAREVVARGIRNTVGFDWHPKTRQLWFTENGQDELGPDRPEDELNVVTRAGEHFGFPYCHGTISDPELGARRNCSGSTPPVSGLGAHVAALGLRFDSPGAAATPAGGSLLVARHGSHPPIRVGYDVVRVTLGGPGAVSVEPFLQGFLQGRRYWGRPVDVLVMPDASVLVSDDLNGAIYRIAAGTR